MIWLFQALFYHQKTRKICDVRKIVKMLSL